MLIVHRPADLEGRAQAILAAMQDERLSLRARGLLGLLLSHAGAEWPGQTMQSLTQALVVRQRTLTGRKAEGREVMRATLGELESAGYLVRRRGGSGSFPKLFIEVFHDPRDVDSTPMRETDGESEVYVVGAHGSSVVKIGTTKNLRQRLKGLQANYPLTLEILWHGPGGWALEQRMHEEFASRRVNGEWFDFGNKDPVSAVLDFTDAYYRTRPAVSHSQP